MSTINQFIAQYPVISIEDGYNNPPVIPETNDESVWLRASRNPESGIWFMKTEDLNDQLIYPGNIVLVDKNKNFTNNMVEIPFRPEERKNIALDAKYSNEVGSNNEIVSFTRAGVNRYVEKCLSAYKNGSHDLASNSRWEYRSSDRAEGISIGGSIKGVKFSGKMSRNKTVTVAYMKQIMYTVSLDNTVSEPSDIFTDKVDLDKFKTNIVKGGGGTPAIIDAVRYGRVVAVWMEQEGNEAPSLSIDEYCKVSVGSTNDSTRFYIRVYGGVAGDQQFAIDTDNKKTLENTLSTLMKEVGKKSMEGAMPMEYSLKYLCNLTTNVEWKLLRYYMSRVWSVKLRVEDNNDGATFHVHVFALRYGLVVNRYQYYRWDSGSRKSLAYEAQLSPKTLCIDIKVDVMWDSGKSDYNIMIPCIPYDTMEPNKKGEWEFKVRLGGTYLGNTKQFDCIPPQPGTYICNNNKTWLANSKNSPTNKYNGASVPEKTVLTDYYNYFHDQEETLKDLRERTNGVINYAPNFKLWTPISGPNGFRPNK